MIPRLRERMVIVGCAIMLLAGCTPDKGVPLTQPDFSTYYWGLQVDVHATTVAVGGTQRVVVTPKRSDGSTLDGAGTPVFTSNDVAKVTVTQDGVVTGVSPTDGTVVFATMTSGGITHKDSVVVVVTPESHAIASLTFERTPGDTLIPLGESRTMNIVALDNHGDPVDGLAYDIRSLDPNVLYWSPGTTDIYAMAVGPGRVVVQTTSYGVTIADTTRYFGGYASVGYFAIQQVDADTTLQFTPGGVVIAVGGTVNWYNYGSGPVNVTFNNGLDHIVGGNIDDLEPYTGDARQFLAVGEYNFTNTINGTKGRVIVRENPHP